MLETYKPPKLIAKKVGRRKINRVFRDREELPTSSNLSDDIQNALKNSKCLIVICSANTPKSQWVEKEIKTFIEMHGTANIMPLLIEGEPEEAFPAPLLCCKKKIKNADGTEAEELLEFMAADIRPEEMKNDRKLKYGMDIRRDKDYLSKSFKVLKVEKLRLLAQMLNCEFNDLKQRQLERKVRRITTAAIGVSTFFAVFGSFAAYQYSVINSQNDKLGKQNLVIEQKNKELESTNSKLKDQILLTEKEKNTAEVNSAEAKKQATLAQQNAEEAIKNFNLAKEREQEAINNLNEATRQRKIAEENEKVAIEQRNTAYRNQSLFLSSLSQEEVKKGDKQMGIMLALQALPKDIENPDKPFVKNAELALRNALYAYEPTYGNNNSVLEYKSILDHKNAEGFVVSTGETKLFSFSPTSVKLWDMSNGALIEEKNICCKDNEKIGAIYESEKYILAECVRTSEVDRSTSSVVLLDKASNNIDIVERVQDLNGSVISEKSKNALLRTLSNQMSVINFNTGKITKLNINDTVLSIYSGYQTREFNDDGSLLAYFSEKEKKIFIYDIINNKILQSITVNNPTNLSFNSKNELFYFDTDKASKVLYRYTDGKAESLNSAKNYLNSYEILDDKTVFVCWEDDKDNVVVEKINTIDKTTKSEETNMKYAQDVVLSPDKQSFIVISGADGTEGLFSMSTLKKISDIEQSVGDYLKYYCQVVFSPDSSYFAMISQDKKIKLWNAKTGGYISTIDEINPKSTLFPKITKDKKIIFVDYDNGIYMINITAPSSVKYFYGEYPWPKAYFDISNKNNVIVSNFDSIKLYSLKEDKFLENVDGLKFDKSSFDFNKKLLLFVQNIQNKEVISSVVNNNSNKISWNFGDVVNTCISSDGSKYLISGKNDVIAYDRKNTPLIHIKPQIEFASVFGSFFINGNKNILVYTPRKIMYYDAKSGELIAEYSPDNLKSGELSITSIKVSEDQSRFVCLYGNGKSEVFDASSRNALIQLAEDEIGLISANDKYVLASHHSNKLSIFDIKSGSRVLDLNTYISNDTINSCEISSDGTKVSAAYGKSGMVYVWDVIYDTNKLIQYSKDMLKGRTLTDEEKKTYFLSE